MDQGIVIVGQVITLGAVVKTGAAASIAGIVVYRYAARAWSRVAAR